MKIIFAGTPDFASKHLNTLLEHNYNVCAAFTQPDRPAGRGRKLTSSPVKELALSHDIPVHQPEKLDQGTQAIIENYQADLIIVVAYGLLIPKAVLTMPQHGCINVHASLLPRWRGAAPIQRAILAGDKETGVTIMQIDEGLDSGDMLLKASCAIKQNETSESLYNKLSTLGATTLIEALKQFKTLQPKKQNDQLVTYAKKIKKLEAAIDWKQSAKQIDQKIRAFNPWPIAQTQLDSTTIRIWSAKPSAKTSAEKPGTIINVNKNGIDVATCDGILTLTSLQLPGKRTLPINEVLKSKASWLIQQKQFS